MAEPPIRVAPDMSIEAAGHRSSAFNGYHRSLTARGGFRIDYCDQDRGWMNSIVRYVAWPMTVGNAAIALLDTSVSWSSYLLIFIAGTAISGYLVFRPELVSHSIEIHPDGLFIDGRFFSIELIGENWPSLQPKGDSTKRFVLCGIYGTRFIEYATVNRIDGNDRTLEVLAKDLELGMELLWGRREAITPRAPPPRPAS